MSRSIGKGIGVVGILVGIGLALFFGFKKATVDGISVGSIFSPQSGATKAAGAVSNLLGDLGANKAADSLNSIAGSAAASARNANMPGLIIGIVIAVVGLALLFWGMKKAA